MIKSNKNICWIYGSKKTYKGKKPDPELIKAAEGLSLYTIIRTMTEFVNKKQKAE